MTYTDAEIEQFIRSFGPANCWTGTVGKACCIIQQLRAEVKRLTEERRASDE